MGKVAQISQGGGNIIPIIKYLVGTEKVKFLHKMEATANGKSFVQNRIKSRKYFYVQPASKLQKISTLNICDGTKQIYPKKQKMILRRDTLRISVAVVQKGTVKKVSLKISPRVFLHIIKIEFYFLQVNQ